MSDIKRKANTGIRHAKTNEDENLMSDDIYRTLKVLQAVRQTPEYKASQPEPFRRSLPEMENKAMSMTAVVSWTVPVIDLKATGQNIKRMRVAAGISVRDLQSILGFTNPQAIYKWQNGDSLPTIDNLVILAAVLGVTVDEILVTDGDSSGVGESDFDGQMIKDITVQW